MADEVILNRIKKLLALSTSSNENESAAAAAKAQELLIRYNLSLEQVDGYSAEKVEDITQELQQFGTQRVEWKSHLAHAVAKANLCDTYYSGNVIYWVGKPSNITVARYLSDTLIADLERYADEYWNGILSMREKMPFILSYELQTIHGREYKRGFYFGAVEVIRQRLTASKIQLRNEPNVNALIVREDRALAVFMSRLGLGRGSEPIYNKTGYQAGREAGSQVSFKTGISAGGSHGTRQIKG